MITEYEKLMLEHANRQTMFLACISLLLQRKDDTNSDSMIHLRNCVEHEIFPLYNKTKEFIEGNNVK